MESKVLLSDFFNSHSEMNVTDHFFQLMVKTNTFDQRLDILQDRLYQAEKSNQQLNKKIADLVQNENEYQQNMKKLEQKFNLKIADLVKKENEYHQKIEQLQEESEKAKIVSIPLEKGVWEDKRTGLIWARISIGQEWVNGECLGNAKKMNWEDAHHACRNFRLDGFSDWRLPSIDELKTLIVEEDEKGYNCPENVLFQPEKDIWGEYWSSSCSGYYKDYILSIGFNNRSSSASSKYSNNYVRVVRGG